MVRIRVDFVSRMGLAEQCSEDVEDGGEEI